VFCWLVGRPKLTSLFSKKDVIKYLFAEHRIVFQAKKTMPL
jgi:hypothetical protein